MKLELKQISRNKLLSQETPAFSARLKCDGRDVATVFNHGNGGQNEYMPAKGMDHRQMRQEIERIETHLAGLPEAERIYKAESTCTGEPLDLEIDLELWTLLELGRIERERNRERKVAGLIRKGVTVFHPADMPERLHTYNAPYSEGVENQVRKLMPGVELVFLNPKVKDKK